MAGSWLREADCERGTALGDHRHPERAGLAGQPGAVVVGPERRRRQVRMQLPGDLALRERVLVVAALVSRPRSPRLAAAPAEVNFAKLTVAAAAATRGSCRPGEDQRCCARTHAGF